jgi:hypothetical protein
MSLKIRFRFDGKCSRHPRYNAPRDGQPLDGNCDGCESLYLIHHSRLHEDCTEKGSQFDRHHIRDEESDGYQE